MKMVDGVLLVVDAFEGPPAQTRFVLQVPVTVAEDVYKRQPWETPSP